MIFAGGVRGVVFTHGFFDPGNGFGAHRDEDADLGLALGGICQGRVV